MFAIIFYVLKIATDDILQRKKLQKIESLMEELKPIIEQTSELHDELSAITNSLYFTNDKDLEEKVLTGVLKDTTSELVKFIINFDKKTNGLKMDLLRLNPDPESLSDVNLMEENNVAEGKWYMNNEYINN